MSISKYMQMKPTSQSLFHFTRSRDVLELILLNGFWPRYCVEDVEWARTDDKDAGQVAMPIVCFCDIPLSRIEEHVLFYGEYGIGLTREWALRSGLSPVQYIVEGSRIAKAIGRMSELGPKNFDEDERRAFLLAGVTLVMNVKPLSGTMVVNGKPIAKEFYPESEWRYVASGADFEAFLMPDSFTDAVSLDQANELTRQHGMLEFLPSDVRYVFVRSDADIPPIMNFIQMKLDHFPAADLKVLMSRVTSLESVRNDW